MWWSGQHESKGCQKSGLSRLCSSARPGPVSLASYSWIHIVLLHSWDLLMKSFFITIVMRHNDSMMLVHGQLYCCHGICDPSDLSLGDTCISPWGVRLLCWTCTSRVTFNASYCRCHLLLPRFQLISSACKPHTSREGGCARASSFKGRCACRTSSWDHPRQAAKFRCFCMTCISHGTMFLIPWTIFCRYLSLKPLTFSKRQQSCSSATLINCVSPWFRILSSHRNCFLESLPESGSLYLPSYQITVINMAQWGMLKFTVDQKFLWCGPVNLPCTQKSVESAFTTSKPYQHRDGSACFGHFPKYKNSSNNNMEDIWWAGVWGCIWGWAICTCFIFLSEGSMFILWGCKKISGYLFWVRVQIIVL